jgi:hypothetical protein
MEVVAGMLKIQKRFTLKHCIINTGVPPRPGKPTSPGSPGNPYDTNIENTIR